MGKSYKISCNVDQITGEKLFDGEIVINSSNDLTKSENNGLMVIILAGKLREQGISILASHIDPSNLTVTELNPNVESKEVSESEAAGPYNELPPEHYDTPRGDLGYLPNDWTPPKH